jgi:hypothetical protein
MRPFSLFILELVIFCNLTSFGRSLVPQNQSTDDSLEIIEKAYLHVDRDSYFPGDDIWFKAYLVNAADRFLSNHSTNLHVELISPDLKIIDSRIVRLEKGLGNGDFHLSEKLPSGKYCIRAYTNYMRNFNDLLFFNKDIKIINSADALQAFSDTINYNLNKPEITFYPEGGSLVDSVTSVVAFKAVDEHGSGYDVSGQIYSSAGEIVTEFKSTHKGMGIFMLDPQPGLKYYALIKNPKGDLFKYEIPESFSAGVVLNISGDQKHKLSVIFKTNTRTLSLVNDHDLTLTVSARSNPFKSYTLRMSSLNSFFNLPTDDLPDGIAMITLSGVNDIPLCERLVYIQNDDEARINIETDKNEYNQRDSVNVKISLRVDSRVPQDAFLSLSATDKLFTDNSTGFPATISSWFLLESDVRGPVEDPSYYFDFSNPGRLKDLDLLLLTQGWRDFKWKYSSLEYPPEYGFSITGKVRKRFADTPVENATVNIGFFENGKPVVRCIPADESGHFILRGIDLTGHATIIASLTDDKDKLKGWLILDSTLYISPKISDIKSLLSFVRMNETKSTEKNLPSFIQYSEFKTSLNRKYKLSDTIKPGEVSITAKRQTLVEKAHSESHRYLRSTWVDQEYEVTPISKTYVNVGRLLTERFWIKPPRQFIPNAANPGISSSSSQQSEMQSKIAELSSQQQGGPVRIEPIIMLNGLEVGWAGIESIPIDWIARVDYVKGRNAELIWGIRGSKGVISVVLKSNLYDNNTNVVYYTARKRFSGFSEPRVFYSPKHHATLEKDYKPDLRTTLFWEPNLKVQNNKNISLVYYNGDNSSTVKIIVEGITTNGIPLTGTTEYEVK